MIEEVFGFPFLLQVGLCPLLHQVLQVIGVLLHPGQQVVKNAGAALPMENTHRVESGNTHTNPLCALTCVYHITGPSIRSEGQTIHIFTTLIPFGLKMSVCREKMKTSLLLSKVKSTVYTVKRGQVQGLFPVEPLVSTNLKLLMESAHLREAGTVPVSKEVLLIQYIGIMEFNGYSSDLEFHKVGRRTRFKAAEAETS